MNHKKQSRTKPTTLKAKFSSQKTTNIPLEPVRKRQIVRYKNPYPMITLMLIVFYALTGCLCSLICYAFCDDDTPAMLPLFLSFSLGTFIMYLLLTGFHKMLYQGKTSGLEENQLDKIPANDKFDISKRKER